MTISIILITADRNDIQFYLCSAIILFNEIIKQAEKLKSREMKNEGYMMNNERWRMMKEDEGLILRGWGVLWQTN